MKRALPLLLKYLAVVAIACFLAFVTSYNTASAQAPNASTLLDSAKVFPAYSSAGTYRLDSSFSLWRDAARQRDVPVKVYFPLDTSATTEASKFPIILFSHGLGGNREGGKRWAEHWASHGFVVVAIQHAGSDESLWKGAAPREIADKMKAGMTIANLMLRIDDVHFVIDEIIRRTLAKEMAFASADATRIGMSGHSFGAQTTLSVAGQKSPSSAGQTGLDKRISAAIAFSPNARNRTDMMRQFGGIRMPFFSITGTEDGSILGDGTKPEYRRLPFEYMPAGQKYLAVFDAGDHMVFGGHALGLRRPETARDRKIQEDVAAGTLAFWNATLKKVVAARTWLEQGGFKGSIGSKDVFEQK